MKSYHAEIAARLFAEGLNCAQAVSVAFTDITGLDKELAMRISSSFGGGMGRLREVCGACSSMFMTAGILYGNGEGFTYEEKTEHYRRIQFLASQFRERYDTIICRELLKGLSVTDTPVPERRTEEYYRARPCVRFVCAAAEILDSYIAENPPKK